MKRIIMKILAVAFALSITISTLPQASFAKGEDAAQTTQTPKYERTILLYDCGADLETNAGMATFNLKQILNANFSKDDKVKFIIMTGGSKTWHLESDYLCDPDNKEPEGESIDKISGVYNQIWEAKGADASENAGKMVLLDGDGILGDGENAKKAEASFVYNEETYTTEPEGGAENYEWMTEPEVLKAFINYGVESFPAEKYDLILWDHGGGPTGGFGSDEHSNGGSLSIMDLKDALSDNAVTKNGGTFDFIDFDACLMSCVELIYGFADYMDYYIASPEVEPGYGQDYEGWLNALGSSEEGKGPAMDTFELGTIIVDDFYEFYETGYGSAQEGTLAVIDVDKLTNSRLMECLVNLNGIMQDQIKYGSYYDEIWSIAKSLHYGSSSFVDLGNLLSQLGYSFWETDYTNLKKDGIDLSNTYSGFARQALNIIQDETIIYSKGTSGIRTEKQYYTFDRGLVYDSQGTSGLYIYMPDTDKLRDYTEYYSWMSRMAASFPDGDDSKDFRKEFFNKHLETVGQYVLISMFGATITEMLSQGYEKDEINYDSIKAVLMSSDEESMMPDSTWDLIVLPWIESLGGEEALLDWFQYLIENQVEEAVSPDNISSVPVETENGSGYEITISDAKKQIYKNVEYNVIAELPAIKKYLSEPGNEEIQMLYNWLPEQLTLGQINGVIQKNFEEEDYEKAVDWLFDKTSVWNLDEFENKWYALKDAEGKLHVTAAEVQGEVIAVPAAYETTAYVKNEATGEYITKNTMHFVYLVFDQGGAHFTAVYFLKDDGGFRTVEASELKGEMYFTPVLYYFVLGILPVFLPISLSPVKINPETLDSLSVEFTDVDNIEDIADTNGDGDKLSLSVTLSNIYGGSLDMSNIVFGTSLETAEVSGIKDAAYTGKDISQELTVKLGDNILAEDTDYTVSYRNNTEPGTASAIIRGKGDYFGKITKTFNITKAESSIKLTGKSAVYTGKAVNFKTTDANVTGSTGKVTYKYYTDSACKQNISASKVKNAGTYYAKAFVEADQYCQSAESSPVKIKITKAKQKISKVTPKKKKVKAGKSFELKAKTSKEKAAISFVKVSGNSKIKVNKNGKVSVKKGLKAGTYTVKLKVNAAATANYKKASAVKKIKIIVR